MQRARRRLLTIPSLLIGWVALVGTAPFTLALAALVGALRRRRFVLLRLNLFAIAYATLELGGLAGAMLAGLPSRHYEDRHYALQLRWASLLFGVAKWLLRLDVRVRGQEHIAPGPILLLMRHTSLADTLIPAAIATGRGGIRLRYVMKKELLLDPCLDVVGNRLPNHFIDRAQPTGDDFEALRGLATGLTTRDGVVIYPEGTRFTIEKRQRILTRMREKGSPHASEADALEHTLPPRVGGVRALVDAAPDADIVFCAHVGLERLTRLRDLLGGDAVGAEVDVAFWRVPAAEVPDDAEAFAAWLFARWKEIDEFAAARQTPSKRISSEGRPSPSVPAGPSVVSSSSRRATADP